MPSKRTGRHRGASRADVLASLGALLLLTGLLAPVLAEGRRANRTQVSAANLRVLGASHDCYAADWNGRQYTSVPDDLGVYGLDDCGLAYELATGTDLPSILLGWNLGAGCNGDFGIGLWGFYTSFCGNIDLIKPLNFEPASPIGSFRLINIWPLHEYALDGIGRVWDPIFYAPDDASVYPVVEPLFDLDCEYFPDTPGFPGPSYVLSPAAMYNPRVFAAPSVGGFLDPDAFDAGYASPGVAQVAYADLKTRLMEHHWLRGAPDGCNEAYDDPLDFEPECAPFLFNHAAAAAPAAVFYDGSVSRLRTGDAMAADDRILQQTGGIDGLWSRDTPLGADGYFGAIAADEGVSSHHILTTNGIRGRDRLRGVTRSGGGAR